MATQAHLEHSVHLLTTWGEDSSKVWMWEGRWWLGQEAHYFLTVSQLECHVMHCVCVPQGMLIESLGRRALIIGGYSLMACWCIFFTLTLTFQVKHYAVFPNIEKLSRIRLLFERLLAKMKIRMINCIELQEFAKGWIGLICLEIKKKFKAASILNVLVIILLEIFKMLHTC